MSRKRARLATPLLAVLALLSPKSAVAEPPAAVSGKFTLDAVAEGLRKYEADKDRARRADRLKKLARYRDPRVAIAMAEYIEDPFNGNLDRYAVAEMARHYLPPVPGAKVSSDYAYAAMQWWKANEPELRRRAAKLPR
jgi:hypothetical protein